MSSPLRLSRLVRGYRRIRAFLVSFGGSFVSSLPDHHKVFTIRSFEERGEVVAVKSVACGSGRCRKASSTQPDGRQHCAFTTVLPRGIVDASLNSTQHYCAGFSRSSLFGWSIFSSKGTVCRVKCSFPGSACGLEEEVDSCRCKPASKYRHVNAKRLRERLEICSLARWCFREQGFCITIDVTRTKWSEP